MKKSFLMSLLVFSMFSLSGQTIRVLLLGDVIGKTGRKLFEQHINEIREKYCVDATIVNGENSGDDGVGITPDIMHFYKQHNVSLVTSGNHIWDCQDIIPYLETHDDLLRPANFANQCPGAGTGFFECKGALVGVVNIIGREFMTQMVDCPIQTAERVVQQVKMKTPVVLVDMHAETAEEKLSVGLTLEGKASAVVGTHTHIQTNDARVLPQGTAYISDLGMSGSLNSVIGFKKEAMIKHFITQMPLDYQVETNPPYVIAGAVIEIDTTNGRALSIEKVFEVYDCPLE